MRTGSILSRLASPLAAGAALLVAAGTAAAQSFTTGVVFGDSTVDSGYYRALASPGGGANFNAAWPAAVAAGAGTPTSRPGLMASEHVASYFGFTLLPANQPGGTNYATSGAKSVLTNNAQLGGFGAAIPIATQIANYLAANGGVASPTGFYAVSGGGNDVAHAAGKQGQGPYPADPTAFVTTQAQGLGDAITSLKNAGAQTIVVAKLPESFPTNDPTERALRTAFNSALTARLAANNVTVIYSDFNATRLAMVANPAAFGFTTVSSNAANTACVQPAGITSAWSLLCSTTAGAPSGYVNANADMTRLFADDSHFATSGQKILANYIYSLLPQPSSSPYAAATLPASRSVQVGSTATAFATIVNTSGSARSGCRISPVTNAWARFNYQTTNPVTNALTGTPNTPVTIPAGGSQSFVIAFTPTAAQPSTDVKFAFVCQGGPSAVPIVGVNTLKVVFDAAPVPDMIAVGLTPSNDGYARTGGVNGTGLFVISSINIGVAASLTARARFLNPSTPLAANVCQTNPSTGVCLAPPAPTVTTTIANNQSTTWGVFIQGQGTAVPPNPAASRVFFEFVDAGGVVRGSTSTAVTTQ